MGLKNSTRNEPRCWLSAVVTLGGDDEGMVGLWMLQIREVGSLTEPPDALCLDLHEHRLR